MSTGPTNLRKVFRQADEIDLRAGKAVYWDYQRLLTGLANLYSFPVSNTVAAFVALSPNNDYMSNLRSLVSVMQGMNDGLHPAQITVSTYKACRDRALSYITGQKDFLLETKGPKTKSFYLNILDPADPLPVTVDGHMVSIWKGERMLMREVAYAKWDYDEVAEGIREVAREQKMIPNQIQAVLWFTWKRIHQVVFDARLSLFGDHWQTRLEPERVRGFAPKSLQQVLVMAEGNDNRDSQLALPWEDY